MDWGWSMPPSVCPPSCTPQDLLLQGEMLHSQMTCATQRYHLLSRKGAHDHPAAFPPAFPAPVIHPFLGCSFWTGRAHSQPPGYQTTGLSNIGNQLPTTKPTGDIHPQDATWGKGLMDTNMTTWPCSLRLGCHLLLLHLLTDEFISAAQRAGTVVPQKHSLQQSQGTRVAVIPPSSCPPASRKAVSLSSQCSLHPATNP